MNGPTAEDWERAPYLPHDPRYCKQHDERVDRKGKCPECYRADDEYAEADRDINHLWRNR